MRGRRGNVGEREGSSEKRGKGESSLIIVVLYREGREGSFRWGLRGRRKSDIGIYHISLPVSQSLSTVLHSHQLRL